jgi:pyruvate kinase
MLETMIDHPQPTRAEVNDVYSAVLDGSHAIMLSAETAMGDYPEESVAEMDRIAREAELELNRRNRGVHTPVTGKEGINDLLAASAVIFAEHMSADCILAFSLEGTTHRALSTASPTVPVYGVLVNHSNLRRLLLYRGLNLTTLPLENKLESLVPRALKKLRDDGIVGSADKVIIVSRQSEPEADESFLLRLSILS